MEPSPCRGATNATVPPSGERLSWATLGRAPNVAAASNGLAFCVSAGDAMSVRPTQISSRTRIPVSDQFTGHHRRCAIVPATWSRAVAAHKPRLAAAHGLCDGRTEWTGEPDGPFRTHG